MLEVKERGGIFTLGGGVTGLQEGVTGKILSVINMLKYAVFDIKPTYNH